MGELINASLKASKTAIENQDADAIQRFACDQFEEGGIGAKP